MSILSNAIVTCIGRLFSTLFPVNFKKKSDANVTSHSIFRADLDVDNAHVVLWNFNKCVYRPVDFKGQGVVEGSVVLVVVVVVEWAYMLLAMDPETKRY